MKNTYEGFVLVDTDVRCGADTSCGQGLKDDRRVKPRKTRPSNIRLNVDPSKPQLCCLSHRLYWKHFLENKEHEKFMITCHRSLIQYSQL